MRRVCLRRKYAIKRQVNARIHGVHAFLFCESTYVVLLNLSVQNALFSGGKDFLDRFSSRNLRILKRNNKVCSLAITAKNDLWISVCAILNVGSDGSYSHKNDHNMRSADVTRVWMGSWHHETSEVDMGSSLRFSFFFFCFSVPCITFLLYLLTYFSALRSETLTPGLASR